jgi:hypothetical protein
VLIVTKRRVRKGEQLTWCYGGCFDDAGEESDQIVSDVPTSQSQSQPSQSVAASSSIPGGGGDGRRSSGGGSSVPDSVSQGGRSRGHCRSNHSSDDEGVAKKRPHLQSQKLQRLVPHILLQRVGVVFKRASGGVCGSSGESGVSGSIAPKGMFDIFEATNLRGRGIVDMGAGDGRVLMAAAVYGASNGWGCELGANSGNFAIYEAALCVMAKDSVLHHIRPAFSLDGALIPGNIDEVVDAESALYPNVGMLDFLRCFGR